MSTWGVTYAGDRSAESDASGGFEGTDPAGLPALCAQLNRLSEASSSAIPRDIDECFEGEADRLSIPCSDVTVTALDLDAQYRVTTPTELPDGEYLLRCRSRSGASAHGPTSYLRFPGPASVKPAGEEFVVSFWEPTTVTVGGSSGNRTGPGRITIEPTPSGLATGLTHLAAAHHTTAPVRSHPSFRAHPPLLELGSETSVPSAVAAETPETGIEFLVPPELDRLFVAAPLAYYLGATVEVTDCDAPVLRADDPSIRYEFDDLPGFQHQCAQLLRRAFFLDCQARRVAPDRASSDGLQQLPIDLDSLCQLDPAARLEQCLSLSERNLDALLPDWHLSTYAKPTPGRITCLPFLLDRLSLVYLPRATELDQDELLEQTLSDAYTARGETATSGVLKPELQAGQLHAWLAPGTPIHAFKPLPKAYHNRGKYRHRSNDQLQVGVVLNDDAMCEEHQVVSDIYEERAADLPIDVTIQSRLDRAELAATFEAKNDFVHYIGHCEDGGLRCTDGTLDVAEIEESNTQTFFLNACGSYDQGLSLVERGSIAGGVTFKKVLDQQAAKVGTAFARLLVHGFSIERALQLARRRIMMGKDYAVVGDGTYALLPSPKQPAVVKIAETGEGYTVSCEMLTAQSNGDRYDLPFDGREILNGDTLEKTVSGAELREVLAAKSLPVIYDGDFHWSEELVDEL